MEAQQHTDGGQPSTWAPLRSALYRNLFIAQFGSNIGTWMQSVAAQWFLVETHSSDIIVADWQAIQPELVPREQIPAASVLGSVSGNAARAIGPAIGGVLVAPAGPAAVFAVNAVSFAGIIVALIGWRRPKQYAPLEREHFGSAIVTGVQYVGNSPIFRRILSRAALFLLALFALLPVAAARRWHLGAAGYGVALGAIGFGAVLAVLGATPLHRRFSDNGLLAVSAAAFAVAPLAAVWLPFTAALPVLALSGMAWLITLTTLNAAAQLSLPRWVRARGLAMSSLVATGSQALCSHGWGAVATRAGLDTALLGSAVAVGAVVFSVAVLPLRPRTGMLSVDISTAWPSPALVFEPAPDDGPVLVTVRYRVPEEHHKNFIDATSEVRRSRLRTGGHSWRLYHGVGQPETLLERFTVASWTEFEHRRTERWVESDHDVVTKAISYTVDGTRTHEYYLAKRTPR